MFVQKFGGFVFGRLIYVARNTLHDMGAADMNNDFFFFHFTTVPSDKKYLNFIY